jgi:hypothetical protein
MRAEDQKERTEELAGWGVRISSYRIGEQYHATIENTAVGARIARGSGMTRESAEAEAIGKALHRLQQTRVSPPAPAK